MITKRHSQHKKVKLATVSPLKDKYIPLTHLDKIKLANHIDLLMQAFIEQVPSQD